jgi:hypothetical protein
MRQSTKQKSPSASKHEDKSDDSNWEIFIKTGATDIKNEI